MRRLWKAPVYDRRKHGGMVSLALQVFYPDEFNGCWSSCPDGVDFRNFQLINIYEHENAFTRKDGSDVPAKRNRNGGTDYSVRHECQLERCSGEAVWELGGQQWASWNAVYGPRDANGPIPPLDGQTAKSTVMWLWHGSDMTCEWCSKKIVQSGNRLNGKIHVWVGDRDEYFLNFAVERFRTMTQVAVKSCIYRRDYHRAGQGAYQRVEAIGDS